MRSAALRHDLSQPLSALASTVAKPPVDPGRTTGGDLVGPIASFEGIANNENRPGEVSLPPDANGDVGMYDYVQWVNTSIAVYDKSGTRVLGPFSGNLLWKGFGGYCESTNLGDPIVLYDRLADRWLLAQLASVPPPHRAAPYLECIAVSQGGDPTGAYYRYAFAMPSGLLNDYPKLAVWPDGYYLTDRRSSGEADRGEDVFAFDRAAMLTGADATMVGVSLGTAALGLLPATLDGPVAPPPGTPALLVRLASSNDALELRRFHVDFAGGGTTLGDPVRVAVNRFDPAVCPAGPCIAQPGTAPGLDPISDRLMARAVFRIVDGAGRLVVSHTVATGRGHAAIRWYDLGDPAGDPVVLQQGTYAPDGDSRWMGSASIDGRGDLAVGYAVSGPNTFPSIGFAGRMPGDPAGTLRAHEGRLVTGNGAQTGLGGRFGDYSSMSVDPVDDCTFWYTQEYYRSTSARGWHTRIGSFQLPGCGIQPTITGVAREGDTLTASAPAGALLTWRRCAPDGSSCVDVASGAAYTVRSADAGSSLRLVALGDGGSGISAPTAPVEAVPATVPLDLVVSATAARQADGIAFSIAVTNHGHGTATGVTVATTVPAGTQEDSLTAARGDCDAVTLVCRIAFLPSGGVATLTLVVPLHGRGAYSAAVAVRADQADPEPASNQAGASLRVTAPPVLTLRRASRKRDTVTVVLAVDEATTVHLRVLNAAGRVVARTTARAAAGTTRIAVRAPRAARRVAVRAVDADGLATVVIARLERTRGSP